MKPERRPGASVRGRGPRQTVALGLVLTLAMVGAVAGVPSAARATVPATSGSVFVNISATSSLSFVPDSFTVLAGSAVHLTITQLANFEHTFTLSSVANTTIPSTDDPAQLASFFNSNAPVVNVSLGSIPGTLIVINFTAPRTLGTYEFVCLIHFPTMTGVMTVASSLPSSASSSGLSPIELIGVGAVVAVAAIVGVLYAWSRSRRRARTDGGSPPTIPK